MLSDIRGIVDNSKKLNADDVKKAMLFTIRGAQGIEGAGKYSKGLLSKIKPVETAEHFASKALTKIPRGFVLPNKLEADAKKVAAEFGKLMRMLRPAITSHSGLSTSVLKDMVNVAKILKNAKSQLVGEFFTYCDAIDNEMPPAFNRLETSAKSLQGVLNDWRAVNKKLEKIQKQPSAIIKRLKLIDDNQKHPKTVKSGLIHKFEALEKHFDALMDLNVKVYRLANAKALAADMG